MKSTLNLTLLAQLRKQTNLSLKKVSQALSVTNNNYNDALLWLQNDAQVNGQLKATQLSSRPTVQGLVAISKNTRNKVIIELNCETDFVSKSSLFSTLSQTLLSSLYVCLNELKTIKQNDTSLIKRILVEDALNVPLSPLSTCSDIPPLPIKTIRQCINEHISKTGENIILKRISTLQSHDHDITTCGAYVHGNNTLGYGRVGALIALTCPKASSLSQLKSLEPLSDKLAQHVVGFNPKTIHDLYQQQYLFANHSVEKQLQLLNASLDRGTVEIKDFCRFECGEEIDGEENKN